MILLIDLSVMPHITKLNMGNFSNIFKDLERNAGLESKVIVLKICFLSVLPKVKTIPHTCFIRIFLLLSAQD